MWRVGEAEPCAVLRGGHDATIYGAALHPTRQQAVTTDAEGRLVVWDLGTGERLRTRELGARVNQLAFDPEGLCLYAGGADGVHVWNARTWKRLDNLPGCEETVNAVTIHAQGALLAATSVSGQVLVWTLDDGKLQCCLQGPKACSVALHPTRPLLASGSKEGVLSLWSLKDGSLLHATSGHEGSVYALDFSPKGQLASGGADGKLRLWRVAGAEEF
ncbi:MAG: WD40 repeat domain-containing protein [Planctomycetota bacterium]|nr:WD40 repeat domain-containing protein [Planctomycetota bacterium]